MNDVLEINTTFDVLSCIEENEKYYTRADVAKQLNLSRTTVSTAVSRLIELGIVQEEISAQKISVFQGRGRPGIPLKLTTNTWYAIGASFHSSTWLFVMTDLNCNVVYKHSIKLPDITEEMFTSALLDGLRHIIKQCPGRLLSLLGIGVPGLVNEDSGVILHAEDLGWHNVPVKETIFREIGIPAIVLNRHRACALAESKFGFEKNPGITVYMGIDTGIIAPIISNGRLLTGASFGAGEIGHTIIDPNGKVCRCGKRGCLQAMAALDALNNNIKTELASKDNPQSDDAFLPYIQKGLSIPGPVIMEAACNNNLAAINGLREISKYLAIAIANLINLLNPQTIILGGPLSYNCDDLLVKLIENEVKNYAMAYPLSTVRIVSSRLGIFSGAIGAASLPLEHKLNLVLKAECNQPL